MKKLPLHLGVAAVILALSLNSLALAQTTTFTPTYTYYDPAFSTTTDPNSTGTTSDPAATNSGTTSTSSTSTTPEPGTYDPAVLQGPSSGGQPVGTTDTTGTSTNTTDPNQPTANTQPTPEPTNSITPTTTVTTRTPSRTVPANPAPTEPLPEPETEQCPPFDPLANQPPVECPKSEVIPVVPQPPYFLGLTALLGVILFWAVFSLLSRQQSRSENRLGERQLTHSHQQTVSSTRQRAYNQLLDFLTATASSDQAFDQTHYQHLSSQIELLGTPAMNDLNQKIKLALEGGKKSELKPLIRELADQIRVES